MPDVNMPKLSDTMEEGVVLEWKKQSGEEVKRGEPLAEIESDKASFEIEAEANGVIQISVEQGKAVPVGTLIARIGAGGEAPATPPQPAPPSPAPKAEKAPEPVPTSPVKAAAPARTTPQEAADGQRIKASPLARRLAEELGVNLLEVKGSGPQGRVVKEDVVAAAQSGSVAAPAARPSQPTGRAIRAESEIVSPNRMQTTIARRMVESKTTVPHFYLTVEVRVDEAVRLRQQLKESAPAAERLTMTDLVTRAAAIALTRFPEVNASWTDDRIERKGAVNIGIAVPPAEGMGLLVPVVHDCDRKDLIQISIDTRQVIERARSGRPGDGDLAGGTFSISNLGMYGIDEFSAIINPPESAILAVGAIKETPVVERGQIKVGQVMRLTLSVDHRVFYGAPAARFLGEIKQLLESPAILLLPPEVVQ